KNKMAVKSKPKSQAECRPNAIFRIKNTQIGRKQVGAIYKKTTPVCVMPFFGVGSVEKPNPSIVKTAVKSGSNREQWRFQIAEGIAKVCILIIRTFASEPLVSVSAQPVFPTDTGGLIKFKIISKIKLSLQ